MTRALLVLLALLQQACHEEARRFREPASSAESNLGTQESAIKAGPPGGPPIDRPDAGPITLRTFDNPYEDNSWAIAQGKRLFIWYNCNGCHASGGGGMGPALMDGTWRYGSHPENIFQTIVQGRPNGMPSFQGRIGEADVWKLVSFVRSMSGLGNHAAAPGRADSMGVKQPELLFEEQKP